MIEKQDICLKYAEVNDSHRIKGGTIPSEVLSARSALPLQVDLHLLLDDINSTGPRRGK